MVTVLITVKSGQHGDIDGDGGDSGSCGRSCRSHTEISWALRPL